MLIRIRPAREAPEPDKQKLALEAEAVVDYASIYPATPFTVDLHELQSSIAIDGNVYGQRLGAQLCSALSMQQAFASLGQPEKLRVQLMLEGSGPHESIRWERMAVPLRAGDPLAMRLDTPFSRFAAVDLPQNAAPEDKRFHLLVAVASPPPGHELAAIDAVAECDAIREACQDLLSNGQMKLTTLPASLPASLNTADNIAAKLQDVDGLHIIAHGRQVKNAFTLILQDEKLGMRAWKDKDLIRLWRPERLRLIFLQSCQSAASVSVTGFMQQLVRAGVPGVVAMQDFIRIDDARSFNRGFYTSLIRDGMIDEAANRGRQELRQSVDAAWSIPAVMTRLKGGAVWRESPLRAAQKQLYDRLQQERQATAYPLFPIDVASVQWSDLQKRSTEPTRDDIETVYPPGEGVRTDAFRTLTESVSKPGDGGATCLIGAHGRAKTTLLEALYLSECERHWNGEQPAVPVMLRLADCDHAADDPQRSFAAAIAEYFWTHAGAKLEPFYLVQCFDRQPFLFLLSGDDNVTEETLPDAMEALLSFRRGGGRHRYVVTLDQSSIKVQDVPEDSTCLIIEPMSVERVTHYLKSLPTTAGNRILLSRLSDGLWDLAEVPWLLSEMLDQAERGVLGKTRAAILKRVADDRIAMMAGPTGMRARVEDVLYRLAWEMYHSRKTNLVGTDVFELLVKLRGNRDYSLVEFRSQLIQQSRMMAPGGEDGLRFAYPGFRSYSCAQYLCRQKDEVRHQCLEEITATLGRRSRAQLWEEVLLILAGLWGDTEALLRLILSGVALSEGDQVYIAARCLQEARQAFPKASNDSPVVRSIVSTLMYRSHPRSLRSVSARKKAIQYLGPLKEAQALPHLISLALRKIRPAVQNKLTYDYSGVRLAAIKALLYTPDEVLAYVQEDKDWKENLALRETLDSWLSFNCEKLCSHLHGSEDVAVASVAAFALSITKMEGAHEALVKKFLAAENAGREHGGDLLWAVTDALLEIGDPRLTTLIEENLYRADLRHQVAYLIGKVGASHVDSKECNFLREHLESDDAVLSGRCLQALAELRDTTILDKCHEWLNRKKLAFRYYALQSLRHIGTEKTLALLTEAQWWAENDAHGSFSIERVRQEVYEEIYWRLAGGRSLEVMDKIPSA